MMNFSRCLQTALFKCVLTPYHLGFWCYKILRILREFLASADIKY